MKNLDRIAELSKRINQKDKTTWIKLYYNIEKKAVYDRPGKDRFFVCDLIRDNSPEDIKEAVNFWLKL